MRFKKISLWQITLPLLISIEESSVNLHKLLRKVGAGSNDYQSILCKEKLVNFVGCEEH